MPVPASPTRDRSSSQTPWSCDHAYVAGALRASPTSAAPGVIWTCRLRDQEPAPLFTRDECAACRRWCPRNGGVSTDWAAASEAPRPSASLITRVRYRRGTPILIEDAPADVLYTVLTGAVKLSKTISNKRAVGIDVYPPGSPLAAAWVVLGSPYHATAVALEGTTCLCVPRQFVTDLITAHPRLVRELIIETGERLLTLMDQAADVAGTHVEARFAHLFVTLAARVGAKENGHTVIRIPLARRDLATLELLRHG